MHAVTEALTVTVEPANDVNPSISVSADRRMFEGLPIGTIVAGIFQVSDIDEGDNLTFSLSGKYTRVYITGGVGWYNDVQTIYYRAKHVQYQCMLMTSSYN